MPEDPHLQSTATPNAISSVRKWVGIGCLAFILLVGSCAGIGVWAYQKGTSDATPAADAFFQNVQNGDSKGLWTEAHPMLRKVTTEAQVDAVLARLDATMGPLNSHTRTGANVRNDNGVVSVRYNYTAQFANGPADVFLEISKLNGRYQVNKFNFNAPQINASPACPSCGFANIAGTKFCSSCGASLSAAPELEDSTTTETVEAEDAEP